MGREKRQKKAGGHLLSRDAPSIIGAAELDFRVRYGNGYGLRAMAAGMYSIHALPRARRHRGLRERGLRGRGKSPSRGDGNMAKPRGLLVMLGCARRRACTCILSTWCSPRGLRTARGRRDVSSRGGLPASMLTAVIPPGLSYPAPAPGGTTGKPEVRPPRSSRTKGRPPQTSCARNR